jgi:hypothetical protein
MLTVRGLSSGRVMRLEREANVPMPGLGIRADAAALVSVSAVVLNWAA